MFTALFLTLLGTSLALPQDLEKKTVLAPSVSIKNGTVIGSTTGIVDSFRGIPFAQPPVGPLRLKPPQPITKSFGTIAATGIPTACPQFFTQVDTSNLPEDVIGEIADSPLLQQATVTGEDCLTINVQRPASANSTSKLPVMYWIFGGGFEFGSTQMYDGTNLVQQSILLNHPMIFVAVNYRVAGFGFLAGKELQKDGSTNLGLRDQRLGLQWVQDNIAAFGGDPTRVTMWGESAGAISVFDQTLVNGGNNLYNGKPLFHGAIMNSGSIIPAKPVNDVVPQAIYDTVVKNAGCSGASDTLACLRSVSYTTLLNAMNSVPGIFSYRSLDLSYLPRPDPNDSFFNLSPDIAVAGGWYSKVPIIIGDQQDEGTLFALEEVNVTTTAQLVKYLNTYFPTTPQSIIAGLVATYPQDVSAGSPYNTGIFNEIYPQFKRLASILGDITFILTRRLYLAEVSRNVPSWSYLATYLYGTPILGTLHGSDLLEIYFSAPSLIPTYSIQTYYISFVNYLNPNTISTALPLIHWPCYNTSAVKLLEFQALGNAITTDDFRNASFTYLVENIGYFRV